MDPVGIPHRHHEPAPASGPAVSSAYGAGGAGPHSSDAVVTMGERDPHSPAALAAAASALIPQNLSANFASAPASDLASRLYPAFENTRHDIVRYLSRRYRRELVQTPAALDAALASHGARCRLLPIFAADLPVGLLAWYPRGGAIEIAYWLDPAHRGRGLVQNALRRLLEALLDAPTALPVRARVHPLNEVSIRVLQRAGFRRKPRFGFGGSAIYEMTRKELRVQAWIASLCERGLQACDPANPSKPLP